MLALGRTGVARFGRVTVWKFCATSHIAAYSRILGQPDTMAARFLAVLGLLVLAGQATGLRPGGRPPAHPYLMFSSCPLLLKLMSVPVPAAWIQCTAVFYDELRLEGNSFSVTTGNVSWNGETPLSW